MYCIWNSLTSWSTGQSHITHDVMLCASCSTRLRFARNTIHRELSHPGMFLSWEFVLSNIFSDFLLLDVILWLNDILMSNNFVGDVKASFFITLVIPSRLPLAFPHYCCVCFCKKKKYIKQLNASLFFMLTHPFWYLSQCQTCGKCCFSWVRVMNYYFPIAWNCNLFYSFIFPFCRFQATTWESCSAKPRCLQSEASSVCLTGVNPTMTTTRVDMWWSLLKRTRPGVPAGSSCQQRTCGQYGYDARYTSWPCSICSSVSLSSAMSSCAASRWSPANRRQSSDMTRNARSTSRRRFSSGMRLLPIWLWWLLGAARQRSFSTPLRPCRTLRNRRIKRIA